MKLTKDIIENAVKEKGYKWFEKGNYNLNIVGVRNSTTASVVTNRFDDKITLSYKVNGIWQFHSFDQTMLCLSVFFFRFYLQKFQNFLGLEIC